MILPEIGFYCLILVLVYQCQFFLIIRTMPLTRQSLRAIVSLPMALLLVACCLLIYAFVSNDFSIWYVGAHSSSNLPLLYRICALWGGHEGSLLLWCLLQSIWVALIVYTESDDNIELTIAVVKVLLVLSIFFELYLIALSNPFMRVLPDIPLEGSDLNPLLQDPGLVAHPPILYIGYVGTSIPFAYAFACCLYQHCRSLPWAQRARVWANYAWLYLSIGIILGSWWAYRELGWGGWWFWDPVENASLMPWLLTSALIHSLMVTERTGQLTHWSVYLAMFTYCFSILGTFIVRSGVVVSVHAFASDPGRGLFLLAFLGVVVSACLYIYSQFCNEQRPNNPSYWGKANLIWINNLCLTLATAIVLLGTLYPMILETLGLGRMSVGPPYYNQAVVPLMLMLLVLMGSQHWVNWARHSRVKTKPVILHTLAVSCLALIAHGMGMTSIRMVLGFSLALWVLLIHLFFLLRYFIHKDRSRALPMLVSHMGFAMVVLAICLSEHLVEYRDVYLNEHRQIEMNEYSLSLRKTNQIKRDNYTADQAEIVVQKGNQTFSLFPEKRYYPIADIVIAKSDIYVSFINDVYITLGNYDEQGGWSMRVSHRPFVRWIWYGGIVMALSVTLVRLPGIRGRRG